MKKLDIDILDAKNKTVKKNYYKIKFFLLYILY